LIVVSHFPAPLKSTDASITFGGQWIRMATYWIEVMPSVEHVQQKYQNNRAENSHQPTRLREKVMRGFKSAGHAQRFLSAFGIITSHFRVGRHLHGAGAYRALMKSRFADWEEASCAKAIVN
jgi:putative transposase